MNLKPTVKIIALPLFLLTVLMSLLLIWEIFGLPSEQELIQISRRYFNLYGYWIVLVSAVIEGILLAGWYYPGSLVILLGVIFAGRDLTQVFIVVGLVTLGLFGAYALNYVIGKYGWYRLFLKFGLKDSIEEAQRRLTKYGLKAVLISYWQPNLAALTSTAAGILHFSFKKFFIYSAVGASVWDAFWGVLVYFLGETALQAVGLRFVLILFGAWIALRLLSAKIKHTSFIQQI